MKYILELNITPEHCKNVNAFPSFVVSEILMELGKKIHNGASGPGIDVEKPGECDAIDYQGNKVGTWKVIDDSHPKVEEGQTEYLVSCEATISGDVLVVAKDRKEAEGIMKNDTSDPRTWNFINFRVIDQGIHSGLTCTLKEWETLERLKEENRAKSFDNQG